MAFLELDHVSVVFPAVQGLLSARKSAPVVAVDGVSLSVFPHPKSGSAVRISRWFSRTLMLP